MLGSGIAVEGRRFVLLPSTAITTAVTDEVTTPLIGAGIKSIAAQCLFSYGSGGEGADFYLQTSFDKGTTWTDIAAFRFPGVEGRLARDFDGSSDYYTKASDLTGNADGKTGIFSTWFNLDTFAANKYIFHCHGERTYLMRATTNLFYLRGFNFGNTKILELKTDTAVTAAGWHHILFSWNLATAAGHVYADDSEDQKAGATLTDDDIDYTRTAWAVAATTAGAGPLDGKLSELYFNTAEYLDFSVAANRRKFISASGFPVPLGATDGSLPTGTQPILYAPDGNPTNNLGSGGNFTAVGSPTSIAGPNTEASRFQVVKYFTPVSANQSIQDGELAANTILDGVLGDRFRIKYSTTGTFANSTIKIDAVVKA